MRIDPADIRPTPEHRAAIAFHAEQQCRDWSELIEESFPLLAEPDEKDLQESLAMCDRGMAEIDAGGGVEAVGALKQLGAKHGFSTDA